MIRSIDQKDHDMILNDVIIPYPKEWIYTYLQKLITSNMK